MKSQVETGMPYLWFKDTSNRANPNQHEGYIPGGNLCVAPETRILTDQGQVPIAELEGQQVNVWNGSEWSNVLVRKTGKNQELLRVNLSNSESLECTPYHHFWVQNSYSKSAVRVDAQHLKPGDKLIKIDLPIVQNESDIEFPYPYTSGFFSGDGSHSGEGLPEIDLYGEKKLLLDHIQYRNKRRGKRNGGAVELLEPAIYHDEKQDRIVCKLPLDMPVKFTVPLNGYTVSSRLDWLAGILDSDGCVYRNGTNEALAITSVKKDFLLQIRLMLQTLGVESKVALFSEAGYKKMPDGKGDHKDYYCQTAYRLTISSCGLYELGNLGLKTHRLKWQHRKPQRNASQFVKVANVEYTGRISDTFCFTEPKRNLGVFNGILTGQCQESWSNVKAGEEAHTCNLTSLNLANIEPEELEDICTISVRLLDNTIELTETPFKASTTHNAKYRTIGVGAMGLADWLAKNKLSYKSIPEMDLLFEDIGYHCTKASMELSKERGAYPAFPGSEWSKGHLIGAKPLSWYADNLESGKLERWTKLSKDIQEFGIRNSHITAIAPNTSSSLVQGCTASILPTYSRFFYDKWAKGTVPIAPPFIKDYFWFYSENKSIDQNQIVKAVATMQKWIDTGISMELIFNLNAGVYFPDEPDRSLKAKDIFDTLMLAWKEGCKAIYYIRTVQRDDFKESSENGCVSCAN
jgi:ribonucleoside-diphosphate reductase alpha chain